MHPAKGLAAPPATVRVAVVSPSPAVRSGLRALIDGNDGVLVIDEAASLAEGTRVPADVVVGEALDRSAGHWREASQSQAVVLLGDRDALLPLRALLRAPSALLLREASAQEIVAAVIAVAHGLSVMDPSLATEAPSAQFVAGDAALAPAQLTPRELDVLRLVASGLPNKAIALELHISDHTVKFHMGSIMSKLDASSRTEAVTLAVRQGLLPL